VDALRRAANLPVIVEVEGSTILEALERARRTLAELPMFRTQSEVERELKRLGHTVEQVKAETVGKVREKATELARAVKDKLAQAVETAWKASAGPLLVLALLYLWSRGR
jgi:thermostable 8-oxoguanine DNA glycosylase